MTRRYRVLLPLRVHTPAGSYEQGEEFEKDFTEDEEAENLKSGLLALVPQKYKVVGGSEVYGAAPGEEFEAALTIGAEAHLLAGGHVERVTTTRKKEK